MTTVDERTADLRRQALDILCSEDFEPIVDMVVSSPAPDTYEARAIDGSVRFKRVPDGPHWRFQVLRVDGRNPLGAQDPGRFSPLDEEVSALRPNRVDNSYPAGFERIAQVFDHPCAPDLCVLHTAAHRPGHHRGEHGSLDVVQSRAPFIVSGAGVRALGLVDRHCLMVDVAPTVLALLGTPTGPGVGPTGVVTDGLFLSRQDGQPLVDVLDSDTRASHVVCVLFDGANANVLYDAAASGALPNVARLMDRGTAFAHGALASLPTVTLANHTTLLTGAHPGHHGVLHNAWFDRALGRQVVTESPATWQEAMQWLFPGVETIHETLKRRGGDVVTVSVNEPADRGATYSTFDLFRRGETERVAALVPQPLPHTDEKWWAASEEYQWGSLVDAAAVIQATGIWSGEFLGVPYPAPMFCWISFSLTDSAMHEGGPYSDIARAALLDTDARLGEVLAAVERRGVLDETAFVLVADHGMEENEAETIGDWGDALRRAGIEHRDEASGFLYLGDRPDLA